MLYLEIWVELKVFFSCTIVKRWTAQKILRMVPYIHLFGWLFPLITTIPPLAAQKVITRNLWYFEMEKRLCVFEY